MDKIIKTELVSLERIGLKIIVPKIKGSEDSFFYEGEVALIKTDKGVFSLQAQGNIAINIVNSFLIMEMSKTLLMSLN